MAVLMAIGVAATLLRPRAGAGRRGAAGQQRAAVDAAGLLRRGGRAVRRLLQATHRAFGLLMLLAIAALPPARLRDGADDNPFYHDLGLTKDAGGRGARHLRPVGDLRRHRRGRHLRHPARLLPHPDHRARCCKAIGTPRFAFAGAARSDPSGAVQRRSMALRQLRPSASPAWRWSPTCRASPASATRPPSTRCCPRPTPCWASS